MTVTILLFASYAEWLGRSTFGVSLSRGATVSTMLDDIRHLPGAERIPAVPLVAVNSSYAALDTILSEGDEVAIIPPVAGG